MKMISSIAAIVTIMMIHPASAQRESGARSITAAERTSLSRSLANGLRDTASAQFRFTVAVPGAICGTVNARNGFGGYTGHQPFIAATAKNRSGQMVGAFVALGSPSSVDGQVAISMCAERGINLNVAR